MDYNLIINPLPVAFNVNGNTYEIYAETERAIDGLERLEDGNIEASIKEAYLISRILTPSSQRRLQAHEADRVEVVGRLVSFLGSAPTPQYEPSGLPHSKEPLIYWATDSPAIVSSFRQAYGIGLQELKGMHFWEFSALLYGLPSDTRMGSLMQTRMMVVDGKESADMKRTKEAQKRSARPKDTRSQEEKERDAMATLAAAL